MSSEQLQNYIQLQSNLYPFLQPLVPPTCTTVNMPASGDYQALLNLQTFIAFGDYDPKVVSDLDLSKLCGPPRIYVDDKNKLKESNPSNPLQDLRTYILAIRTSAEPLRRLALIRLYSQQLLKKEINAMHFLEEIYTGSASKDSGPGDTLKDYKPDGDLRRFVQAFLCAAHPDLPTKLPGVIQLEYEETIYGRRVTNEKDTKPATKDNTNLYILQTTGKYKDRLSKLRGKGGLFLEDLDKVKNALDSKEPIQVPDKLFSHTEKASLPAPEPAISSLADLQWLETAEEHRRAYALYQNYLRRRPVLGLRGMPAVGDIIGGVRLEDLERLDRLRV